MVVQLVRRDLEALDDLVRRDRRAEVALPQLASRNASSAWRTPKRSGATGPAGRSSGSASCRDAAARGGFVGSPSWASITLSMPARTSSTSSGGESGRARPSWRRTQPASWPRSAYSVVKTPSSTLPRSIMRSTHHAVSGSSSIVGLADDLAELPVLLAAVLGGLEFLRQAEVALPPRGEADVAADPRDAERAHRLAVVVVADHVPGAALGEEGVGG